MIEVAFALLAGLFVGVAVFLLLSRSLLRMLLGISVLGNGVNLLILVGGRLTRDTPPILAGPASGAVANPLPQALILTAIVIGFALFAFLLFLAYRAQQMLATSSVDDLHTTEPVPPPTSPSIY